MPRPYDIIALGELNVDLLLNRIGGFPEVGKEIFAKDMTLTLGSSTAIFAANAASLGAKVAFLGMVGRDNFGDLVRNSLAERGVDTSLLIESESAATGLTAILNYGNDRANVTYPGVMSKMGVKDIDPELLKKARHVHISSIFLQEQLHKDLLPIVKLVKECGCTVSMDVQWDPDEKWEFDYKEILPYVDVFLPNETEIQCLTGTDSVNKALEVFGDSLNAAVVKMGTQGSLLVRKDGTRRMLPALLNQEVVDAIGAGDSFNAGFIYGYVKGLPLERCQELGNLTGAINTTAAGGTGAFRTREDVERTACERFGKTLD